MLNNASIISTLTDEQKIALVADIAAANGEVYGAAGVPYLEKIELDALNGNGEYACPDLAGLSSAWNTKLVEFVTSCLLSRTDIKKYNFIGTPGAALKTGPCSAGLTEDPHLNSQITNAFVSAINGAGAAAYIAGCSVNNVDTEYLDGFVDPAAYNLVTRGLFDTVLRDKHAAVELSCKQLKGDWKNVNTRIADTLHAAGKKPLVLRDMPEEVFLSGLTDRNMLFSGASVSSLRSALKNYVRMKEDVEHGAIGVEELEKAVAAGTAVSAEMLDVAVDKVIEFIKSVASRKPSVAARSADECRNAALFSARECIVLLKNAGALPLTGKQNKNSAGAKLAVVGELANEYNGLQKAVNTMCNKYGMQYVGIENGYKLDEERSDSLLPSAVKLARGSDVVLAFIGLGRVNDVKFSRQESLNLPANQFALIDEIHKAGKKLIAVVVGSTLPNMKFDEVVDGIVNIPFGGGQTIKALCEILSGEICPSGKLTAAAYNDADEFFAARKQAVAAGRYKIGQFVGYRRHVSENFSIRYPFGFGLSYCKFNYSGLKVTRENVEVTVKNTGAMPAAEIVQLYVGKKSSAIVRPARELKGFVKVFIDPGKSARVRFPLTSDLFDIVDTDGKRKTESGEYELYVGASAADIRLTGSVNMSGVKLEKSVDRLSDYLPTVGNIVEDGFKMNSVSSAELPFRSARPDNTDVSYEKLFADEFAELDDDDGQTAATVDEDENIFSYLDESVTVSAVADGLVKCGQNVGIGIDKTTATELVAAFAASRVVLLRSEKPEFDLLVSTLCEYLGCPLSIDNAAGYSSPDDLFADGNSALVSGIGYAASRRESITVIALDNIDPTLLGKMFTPFIRYATAPDKIKVTYGTAKRALDVPKNIWFVMRLRDGRCEFPAYVADMATVLFPKVTAIDAAGGSKLYPPNFYQFVSACRRAESKYELEEAQWKKLDALEKLVASRSAFKLGNKLCVQIERIASVLLECGVNQFEALDGVVAAKLVPHIATALEGRVTADEGGLIGVFDGIFGEDDSARIKQSVRRAVGKEGGV